MILQSNDALLLDNLQLLDPEWNNFKSCENFT
jgi:hypothetical protein